MNRTSYYSKSGSIIWDFLNLLQFLQKSIIDLFKNLFYLIGINLEFDAEKSYTQYYILNTFYIEDNVYLLTVTVLVLALLIFLENKKVDRILLNDHRPWFQKYVSLWRKTVKMFAIILFTCFVLFEIHFLIFRNEYFTLFNKELLSSSLVLHGLFSFVYFLAYHIYKKKDRHFANQNDLYLFLLKTLLLIMTIFGFSIAFYNIFIISYFTFEFILNPVALVLISILYAVLFYFTYHVIFILLKPTRIGLLNN